MLVRIVRRRSGSSRGPSVSIGNPRSSRTSIAAGERTVVLAAASSIANGRPSSRRQISTTSPALPSLMAKSGRTACDRSTNSRTASYRPRSLTGDTDPGSGNANGATSTTCSAPIRSLARLVTNSVRPGQSAIRSANAGPASNRCSKLSRNSSIDRCRKQVRNTSATASSRDSRPRAPAITSSTSPGSRTEASATNATTSNPVSSSDTT